MRVSGCYSCERETTGDLPERLYADDLWRVAHAFDSALPGWLIVLPPRQHADLPVDHRGLCVFAYLGAPPEERVPEAERHALAARLGAVVTRALDVSWQAARRAR